MALEEMLRLLSTVHSLPCRQDHCWFNTSVGQRCHRQMICDTTVARMNRQSIPVRKATAISVCRITSAVQHTRHHAYMNIKIPFARLRKLHYP